MYMQNIIALGMISLFTWGCGNSDKQKGETVQTPLVDKVWYSNPVIDSDNPDPTVIKAEDGYFYLYATGGNTWIHKSKDLVHWTYVSGAYEEDKKPSWEPDAGIWAPDINYIDGKYVMYYSLSKWGGGETCGIGVSVSDRPEGPFTDQGKLFRSNEIGVHNSIDPFYIEDNGKKYLFWGSWYGIWGVELSEDRPFAERWNRECESNKNPSCCQHRKHECLRRVLYIEKRRLLLSVLFYRYLL